MTDQFRTPEEIEQLKTNWAKDPIWDIEDTEGFEAHREELKAWREDREVQINKRISEQAEKRIEAVMNATGLGKADRETLLALHTFEEIEVDVLSQDRYISKMESISDQVKVELMQAQVRAILLQAAQLKRIADVLESMQSGNDSVTLFSDEAWSILLADLSKDGK